MDLLVQPSYITNLREFIAEQDTEKALRFWIENYIPNHIDRTPDGIQHAITRSIADLDELINNQINEILHHCAFQKLEASWRGLLYLVDEAEGSQNIKIKMLDISWGEVSKDIGRALEFDQSLLFHKIYTEEYGTPGGDPYGVIIGDYAVSHKVSLDHPHDDIATLDGMAQIAAASFAPFITSASSEFFGLDDFEELGLPINLDTVFKQAEYIRWRALREKPDSRFVGITLPRILMRRPYVKQATGFKGIHFEENCAARHHNHYLWGNACYAFAGILLREFANVGWFGHIRGVPRNYQSGGLVTSLPIDDFETDAPGIAFKPVTEVIITDSKEKELSELGFIPLCQCYSTPFAAFYNNQSIQQAQNSGSNDARINARLSAMLQHVFCGSRIAHYIKIIVRDKIGSFLGAAECEDYLRNWLYSYTTGREDYDWEDQARYPLRAAEVQVKEHPMRPGYFACVIRLKPHYQLDHMVSELEMVTELAPIG
ncbi:MAG: type VI secretion system contractile sheath large subunit [Gammaproteobacteria bacterium]|nr:type VI secretion system contractile sheath large subunit [Gammaproteobacteria bacterium]